ncbi:MAG: hypothetical protein ACI32O_10555 [Enterococcus sp.]
MTNKYQGTYQNRMIIRMNRPTKHSCPTKKNRNAWLVDYFFKSSKYFFYNGISYDYYPIIYIKPIYGTIRSILLLGVLNRMTKVTFNLQSLQKNTEKYEELFFDFFLLFGSERCCHNHNKRHSKSYKLVLIQKIKNMISHFLFFELCFQGKALLS